MSRRLRRTLKSINRGISFVILSRPRLAVIIQVQTTNLRRLSPACVSIPTSKRWPIIPVKITKYRELQTRQAKIVQFCLRVN